jgi:hypothetical protein
MSERIEIYRAVAKGVLISIIYILCLVGAVSVIRALAEIGRAYCP